MPLLPFKENSGIPLNVFRKRGLSEEQPVPDTLPMTTSIQDAFKLDAMTLEPDNIDTLAPNAAAQQPSQPFSLSLETPHLPSSSGPGDPLEDQLHPRLSQLVNCSNSKDSSSSDEECMKWPADKETDRQREKSRPKDTEKESQQESETVEVNGKEVKRSERLIKSPSVREEGRVREKRLEKGVESLEEKVDNVEKNRGDKRKSSRHSKRQHKREVEKEEGQKGVTRSGSSASSPAITPSSQEGVLSDNQVRRLEEMTVNLSDLTECVLHARVY